MFGLITRDAEKAKKFVKEKQTENLLIKNEYDKEKKIWKIIFKKKLKKWTI